MIRIVVAEDQGLMLSALAKLLNLESDLEVLAQAAHGQAALDAVERWSPDVLVTDIEMPMLSGLEVARQLRARGVATKVLVVTTFGRPGYLRRAMDAGVRGYLLKDAPSEELALAIRRVARGERVIAAELIASAWDEVDPLTDRERSVLRLAELGRSAKEIAKALGLSPGTTRNYLHEASQKLGARNRIEAVRLARERGYL